MGSIQRRIAIITLITTLITCLASPKRAAAVEPRPDETGLIDLSNETEEKRITQGDEAHSLANINVWSPDSEWIVYDIREDNRRAFDAVRIEAVNIQTRETRILYTSKNGAGCGVATWAPKENRVAFILGPENPSPDWNYAPSRRRGLLVDFDKPETGHPLDAMNYAPPFTPGALRGGSHVHVFSPDGKLVSFTYDDEILSRLDCENASPPHQSNQRNIGVAMLNHPVVVVSNHPRNNNGTAFSVLVTQTTEKPRSGSDEISKAFEEGWIGTHGYVRSDGTRQQYALAFQGLVTSNDGAQHSEVFVVDLPDDLTHAGAQPLEGNTTHRPFPPQGTIQRRLTFTDSRKYPGLALEPRHWLRSSPNGSQIAFIMKDDSGLPQLWTVSPNGGPIKQISHLKRSGIASAFSWSPDSRWISAIADGSICIFEVQTGKAYRLTPRRDGPDAPGNSICVSIFSPDGRHIAYQRNHKLSDRHKPHVFILEIPQIEF